LVEHTYNTIPDAIKTVFMTTDQQISEKPADFGKAGSTAAVALVRKGHDGKRYLYCANVGDARIVIR
jgi:serine/threonine protein phosphatase PrpC